MVRFAVPLLIFAAAAGCGATQEANGSANQSSPAAPRQNLPRAVVVVTQQQKGSVTVRVGEPFEVRLYGNETIYPPDEWRAQTLPPNVRQTASRFEVDDPDAAGSGGTVVLRFEASAAGEGEMVFDSGPSEHEFRFLLVARQAPAQ
ncbi:MAG TPA: protease inhibitor I42 family protein [Allosphingosinicella sp.]|jgi:hypothetical protein|nr:protease inhibitor I42 family protein [Allosphingosinicella sp.]